MWPFLVTSTVTNLVPNYWQYWQIQLQVWYQVRLLIWYQIIGNTGKFSYRYGYCNNMDFIHRWPCRSDNRQTVAVLHTGNITCWGSRPKMWKIQQGIQGGHLGHKQNMQEDHIMLLLARYQIRCYWLHQRVWKMPESEQVCTTEIISWTV